MFSLIRAAHFVDPDGRKLMGGARVGWRDQRAESFTLALALHVLLGAAVIYLVTPPLPQPEELEPIQIVTLPEPPRPIPPEVTPPKPQPQPKPVPRPEPVRKAVIEPPPEPAIIQQPTPVVLPPRPPEPVLEDIPEPPRVEPPPVVATPPTPVPKLEDVYIPPDSNAAYLNNPKPVYPMIAQRRGWEGTTLLEVRVSATGKPLFVRVKVSSGYKVLDDTAVKIVQEAYRFEPARRNGEKVEATVELPMRFALDKG